MKTIILTPEQNNLSVLQITVREKNFKEIKKMQYRGGFKRFGLTLFDDESKGKYTNKDAEILGEWLGKVFIKQD